MIPSTPGCYIDGWNERCKPFVGTKDADTILAKTFSLKPNVNQLQTHDASGLSPQAPRLDRVTLRPLVRGIRGGE